MHYILMYVFVLIVFDGLSATNIFMNCIKG